MQHIQRKLSVKHEALEKHTEVHGKAYTGQTSYIKVNKHTHSFPQKPRQLISTEYTAVLKFFSSSPSFPLLFLFNIL